MNNEVVARARSGVSALALLAAVLVAIPVHGQKESAHASSAPKPEKLWAAQTSTGGITLTWGAVPGALGYLLHCAIGEGAPRLIGRPAANALQWQLQIVAGMVGEVQRCFLQAQTAKGLSEQVAFNPVVPAKAAAAPAAPASVTATQSAPEEITLEWSEVAGATAYFIARSVGTEGYRVLCRLCPITPTYVDRDVATGVRYSYAVAAVSPGGTSRRTNSSELTTETAIALGDDAAASDTSGGGAPSGGWTPGGTSSGGTPGGTPTGGSTSTGGTSGGSTSAPTGGSSGGGTATPRVQPCVLEYERADNMWAAHGRPDGDLGTERLTLQPGQTRTFVTDWRYEKTRNDGTNYYGSHGRVARNAGATPVRLRIKGATGESPLSGLAGSVRVLAGGAHEFTLEPGARVEMKADLAEAFCCGKS